MTRPLAPHDIIALPRLDANQAVVLALQLEGASLDENKKPRLLPEAVADALSDVKGDREALQDILGGSIDPEKLRPIDRQEDNAIAALLLILAGWTRVKDQFELGAIAASVGSALGVAYGLSFINISPRDEYGVVDTKLKTIEREALELKLDSLGLSPLLAHLREVHERYGDALGVTQPLPTEQRGAVRARYDALLESLRQYVTAVMGSVQKKKPATKVLADALLRPLAEWRDNPPQKSPKESTPAAPPTKTEEPDAGGGKTPV